MYNMRNVTLPLSPCDSLFETIIQLVYKRKIVCGERQWTVIIRHVQIGRSLFFFFFQYSNCHQKEKQGIFSPFLANNVGRR